MKQLLAALALFVLAGAVWAAVDEAQDRERIRELERAVADSAAKVDSLRAALESVDARADTVIRERRETIERIDTVQVATGDSIRDLLAERHEHLVDSLQVRQARKDSAYEAIIDQKDRQIAARDSMIAALEGQLRAEQELVDELKSGDKLFGFLPEPEVGPSVACGYIAPQGSVGCAAGVGVSF